MKAGEAIFEAGTDPAGPALFAQIDRVKRGECKSRELLERFPGRATALDGVSIFVAY